MTSPTDRDSTSWLPTPPWGGLPPLFGAPWERQGQEEPRVKLPSTEATLPVPSPSPPRPVPPPLPVPTGTQIRPISLGGPGCRAADSCGLVLYYLSQLAEGEPDFGVLRVAKERLEDGAVGAGRMGSPELGNRMREVSAELPQVRTSAAAAALVPRLKELCHETWDLGRRCGGHNLSPEALEQARALARDVKEGKLSMEEAVKQVRQEKFDAKSQRQNLG